MFTEERMIVREGARPCLIDKGCSADCGDSPRCEHQPNDFGSLSER
jgi:hypothetical protein